MLKIQDIDGVVAASRKAGWKIYPEERLETHDGRVGREVGIVDPDGNLVVIYYILHTSVRPFAVMSPGEQRARQRSYPTRTRGTPSSC